MELDHMYFELFSQFIRIYLPPADLMLIGQVKYLNVNGSKPKGITCHPVHYTQNN